MCASGNIWLECYPLLWRLATFDLNVTRCYDVWQHLTWMLPVVMTSGNIWLECYPLLWRLATFDLNVTRCYDVWQHLTWMSPVAMTSGNIWLECYPLLWRLATFDLNVTRCYDVWQHLTWMLPVAMTSGNIWLECYPLLWRLATFDLNVTRCYDVWQHFTWMLPVAMTSGNISLECYPLLRCCAEHCNVCHWFLNLNHMHIFFTQSKFFWMLPSSLYPLLKLCNIQNFQTNKWPMKLQEINLRYNKHGWPWRWKSQNLAKSRSPIHIYPTSRGMW